MGEEWRCLIEKQVEEKVSTKGNFLLDESDEAPSLICSRMTRLYNEKGDFLQGSTSFFLQEALSTN